MRPYLGIGDMDCQMHRNIVLLIFALSARAMTFAADVRPDLGIALGERNEGAGLWVPSGGDGVNAPETVQGSPGAVDDPVAPARRGGRRHVHRP